MQNLQLTQNEIKILKQSIKLLRIENCENPNSYFSTEKTQSTYNKIEKLYNQL